MSLPTRGTTYFSHVRLARPVAEEARREMTYEEAERFVHGFLSDGRKHTTQEIDEATKKQGKRCPDSTVRFLSRMRLLGKIEGDLSPAHRTWLWWLPGATGKEPPVP